MYEVKPHQLTQKTLVYRVTYNNKFVAMTHKESAANNLARLLNESDDWKNYPWKVKMAFIDAFHQTEPYIKGDGMIP